MTIVNELCESLGGKIINSMDELFKNNVKFIVFGASTAGKKTVEYLLGKGCDVLFYCDNDINKQGKCIDGLLVIPPNDLLKYHDIPVAIGSCFAFDIAKQLRSMSRKIKYFDVFCISLMLSKEYEYVKFYKRNASAIDFVFNRLADDESRLILESVIAYRLTMDPLLLRISKYRTYFHPVVKPKCGYAIIDAGAWEGDTAKEFADMILCNTQIQENSTIYSFEPFPHSFDKLNRLSMSYSGIIKPMQYALGAYSHDAFMDVLDENNASITMNMAIYYSDIGKINQKIIVKTIDELFFEEDHKIDLIKMDIEGGEINALHGAQKTITTYLPDLQISIYHKIEDIVDIPKTIDGFSNKYAFYVGHHGDNLADTVLYATARQ